MFLRSSALAGVPAILAVGGGACVIPPPLEIGERDAGTNYTPRIVSAGPSPDFSFPGPITLDRTAETRRMTLALEDPDIDDTLHARLYVDYEAGDGTPRPSVGSCSAPASDTVLRFADCAMATVCTAVSPGDTDRHLLEVMVADRAFLQEGEPAFRALPEGARYAVRSWLFTCIDTAPM